MLKYILQIYNNLACLHTLHTFISIKIWACPSIWSERTWGKTIPIHSLNMFVWCLVPCESQNFRLSNKWKRHWTYRGDLFHITSHLTTAKIYSNAPDIIDISLITHCVQANFLHLYTGQHWPTWALSLPFLHLRLVCMWAERAMDKKYSLGSTYRCLFLLVSPLIQSAIQLPVDCSSVLMTHHKMSKEQSWLD